MGSGGGGDTVAATTGSGDVVAKLELAQPSIGTFVLHGTIPVPKGTYPRPDGKAPFSIRDFDGTVVPTQVEVVSRYPDAADGADVIEVLGRVRVAPGTPSGQRLQYEVVDDPHAPKKFTPSKPVLSLLSHPGTIMLMAQDCFGNTYSLDLTESARDKSGSSNVRDLRKGNAAAQFRSFGLLQAQGGQTGPPTGPLPHLMAAHAYFTAWSKSDVVSLDLRISAGMSGHDSVSKLDDPMGPLYFRSLEVWVKKGWSLEGAIDDSAEGQPYDAGNWTAYPIVKARTDGKLHFMPQQSQFHRRLALSPVGKEAEARAYAREQHIGFARRGTSPAGAELFSWWNPQTARYFPTRHLLPDLSHLNPATLRNKHAADLNEAENLIAQGTPDQWPYPQVGALGWAYPWGSKYGGMTGGVEINLLDGVAVAEAASNAGYNYAQLTHRMNCDRQPTVLFNQDGEPTRLSQWVIHGSQGDYVNMQFYLTLLNGPDPFGLKSYPKYQENYVKTNGLQPTYETNLDGYNPNDLQHYIRFTRSPKTLAWLGNDAIAKDDLLMAAELSRLSYHDLPTNPNGSAIGSGMLADINTVTNHPNSGFGFGRADGWDMDTMSAAYSLGTDAWRQEALPWFQTISDLISNGQITCSGFVQRCVNAKNLNGAFQTRQAYEETIWQNGLRAVLESTLRGEDPARTLQTEDTLRLAYYGLISPLGWGQNVSGPWSQTAVMPLNSWTPYCTSLPPGGWNTILDKYYTWSTIAYGLQLTSDPEFLSCADAMAGGPVLTEFMADGTKDLHNRAAMFAAAQQSQP